MPSIVVRMFTKATSSWATSGLVTTVSLRLHRAGRICAQSGTTHFHQNVIPATPPEKCVWQKRRERENQRAAATTPPRADTAP